LKPKFLVFILILLVNSCTNMPTPASQITGTYSSGVNYKNLSCSKLIIEKDNLKHREMQLVAAQEQRIRTSETQAMWFGYGDGDGIEASELASVRGELNAVEGVLNQKNCEH